MKKIILTLSFLISLSSFAGLHLRCSHVSVDGMTGWVYGEFGYQCSDKQGNRYEVAFHGIGGGLEGILANPEIAVSCPFVRKQRILDGKPLRMLGRRHGKGLGFGGEIGAGINHRGAICFIAGFSNSIGASSLIGEWMIRAY